jgi:hypothetical protein
VRTLNGAGRRDVRVGGDRACRRRTTFNTFTVYPEIAAGLAVIVAFYTTLTTNTDVRASRRGSRSASRSPTLPWLSTKYAPMSAALFLVVVFRLGKREPATYFT